MTQQPTEVHTENCNFTLLKTSLQAGNWTE